MKNPSSAIFGAKHRKKFTAWEVEVKKSSLSLLLFPQRPRNRTLLNESLCSDFDSLDRDGGAVVQFIPSIQLTSVQKLPRGSLFGLEITVEEMRASSY